MEGTKCEHPLANDVQSHPVITYTIGTKEIKMSLLRGALIKRVNFKDNYVWSGTKKSVHNNECPY